MSARCSPARTPPRESVRNPAQGANFGEFAAQFPPRIAGVAGQVQLAVMAARDDQSGVGRVCRKGPDRRVRLDRQGLRLPTPSTIARALDRAGAAGRTVAGRGEQCFRIIRFLRQTAAVAQRELVAYPEPPPTL